VRDPVPVRDAATVMLVQDGGAGLQVFMVRRSLSLVFGAGAYVFPGGALDDGDRDRNLEGVCQGRTDAEASAALGVKAGGLAFWVAAIRECFEEAGFLLAYGVDGELVRLGEPIAEERFSAHRQALRSGRLRLAGLCESEDLRLPVAAMHYVSRWITPEGSPRRFDTRFFVAAAPTEQTPLHDATETIAHEWVHPADAVARSDQGELDLMFPTRRSLEWLAGFDSAAAVLAAAGATGASVRYQRG
jgi:8-oxo-dGTP pyrophosphatase MutT (NUDIX family)